MSMLKEVLFLFSTAYMSESSENKQSANRLQRRYLETCVHQEIADWMLC